MKFTKEMIERAKVAKNGTEILELAKANNIEMTEEQANECFAELHKSGELADEELENITGAGICDADPNYASGDTPLYHKGQVVYYKPTSISVRRIASKVTFVHPEKSGIRNKEFTYDIINVSSGIVTTDVYESELTL